LRKFSPAQVLGPAGKLISSVPAGLFKCFPPLPLTTPQLSTGACRIASRSEDYACLFPFYQNSGMEVEGVLFSDLVYSKHPADVPFKKSSGHVRHIKCPHTLKTFLKKCCALFE